MEERPKLGLENSTGRARLRGTGHMDVYLKHSSTSMPKVEHSHIASGRETRSMPAFSSRPPVPKVSFEPPHLPKQSRSKVLKRQVTKPIYKTYPKHHRPVYQTVLAITLLVMLGGGLIVLFLGARADRTVRAQAKQATQITQNDIGTVDGTISEEADPESLTSYQTAPDLPRYLTIEKINVKTRVRSVVRDKNGTLLAPSNIYDVGWYDGSAKPGEAGTIVMDGHVLGPTKGGVFYSLGTLGIGDKLIVERGDGKSFSYSVTATRLYDNDKVDMEKILTTSVPGKPALNLITASGRFNVRTNQFEPRLAIFAVQD